MDKLNNKLLFSSDEYKPYMEYWKGKLNTTEESFILGGNVTGKEKPDYATTTFSVSTETTEAIFKLVNNNELGVFVTVTAFLNAVLAVYSRGTSVVIQTPLFTGNKSAKTYTDSVLLMEQISKTDSIKGIILKLQKTLPFSYKYQHFPVQEYASIEKLNEINTNVSVSYEPVHEKVFTKKTLHISVSKVQGQLQVQLEYNRNVFEKEFITQFAGHYEKSFAYLKQLDTAVKDVQLQSEDEKKLLIEKFNATAKKYTAKTVLEMVEEQVEKTPDAVALEYAGKTISYAELNEKANQLANYLSAEYQLKPDDLVAVYLNRSEWMVISILAIQKAGAAYLPIDSVYPDSRVNYILNDAQVKAVITEDALLEKIEKKDNTVNLDKVKEAIAKQKNTAPKRTSKPENLAYVIYTSGSTGKPKGCEIELRNFSNYINWATAHYFGKKSTGNFGLYTSLAFDLTITSIFSALTRGKKLFIYPEQEDINKILEHTFSNSTDIDAVKITPAHISLLKNLNIKNSNVSTAIVGGDQLTTDQVAILNAACQGIEIYNEYGPTETTVGCIVKKIEKTDTKILIGTPIANTQIYLVNELMQVVPAGVSGEICIAGKGVGRGYLNRAELTASRFVENPYEKGTKMYRTGDLAKVHHDGNIEFIGRIDHQVKIRGYRIELGEIENELLAIAGIKEAVVLDNVDEQNVKYLSAYIRTEKNYSLPELREKLSVTLPDYMVPTVFTQVDEIPLTTNGKVDRKALQAIENNIKSQTVYVAPQTPTQQKLEQLWKVVLGKEEIGIQHDFFELGGHSLKATQLVYKINQAFDVSLELRQVFSNSTIEKLAALIDTTEKVQYEGIKPIAVQEYYDLSNAQRRIWVLSQFAEASLAYNQPAAFEIKGNLDTTAFDNAYRTLISRHEILRTVFVTVDDTPKQKILRPDDLDFSIQHIDIRAEKKKNERLNEYQQREANTVFDLEKGPLVRSRLIRTSDNEFVFLFTTHHIVSDGWSMGVIINELLTVYHAYEKGEKNPLSPLTIQYKDFSAWQNAQLSNEKLAGHQNYWLQKMSGEIPVLELPTDNVRPKVQTFNGDVVSFTINKKTADKLRNSASQKEGTLFMSLLSAINVLMYKYSGQSDIIIGSPIAGRDHADLDNQIGIYMNILALRTQFESGHTYAQLFEQVKQTTFEAYSHQVYPFDKLVNELQLERDLSRSALFDVAIMLQNLDVSVGNPTAGTGGLSISSFDKEHKVSKYDITFVFSENTKGINASIEYNTDLFVRARIEKLAEHLNAILESVAENEEQKISEINYLSEKEKTRLLEEFNNTTVKYPKDKTIVTLFEDRVKKQPNDTAIVFEGEQLSYNQLNEAANKVAHYLIAQGVKKEEPVGIFVERSAEMMPALLGILKAGAAYVPLDPNYPQDRIAYIIEDAGLKTIVTQEELIEKIPAYSGNKITLNNSEVKSQKTTNPEAVAKPENLAYIIYTSGSTGKPKGVLVQHYNVVNFFIGMNKEIGNEGKNTLLAVTTISFDISVLEMFWTLTEGFKVVIQPGHSVQKNTRRLQGAVSTRKMDFSLFYFASGEEDGNKYKMLLEGAKFADKNGFSAIWTPERHFHEFGGIYPNPSVTGAAVSTITEHIKIRSGSCVLPLHNPIRVAEEWSVVDNLSNGRVELSFATGWVLNDFLAFAPDSYHTRHKVMYDGIETVKKLWRGESINLTKENKKESEVKIYPKPIQKELPIWITAAGNPETFRTAGQMGAGLLTHLLGQSVEELAEKIQVYRTAYKEAGHHGEGQVALMIHTFVTTDIEEVKRVAKEPFKNYLRSALGLVRNLALSFNMDIDSKEFNEADMNALLEHAFNRYYNTAALLGTPESCLELVNHLSAIGVNELGCLADFGIPSDIALENLKYLHQLKQDFEEEQANAGAGSGLSLTEAIKKNEVTHIQCTPSMMKILLTENNAVENLKPLKKVLLGGEALPYELVQEVYSKLNVTIHNMYGPTETTIWSATDKVEKEKKITIGKPIANTQLLLLDKDLKLVAEGVSGEIWIGGEGVTRGYLNRPELTAERFIENPYKKGERLYKTGDVGKWLSDGRVEYIGRNDEQVKIRGHRIELGEIESRLKAIEKISDAVVVVKGETDKELVAYVIPAKEITAEEIRSALGKNLPEYMIPNYFVSMSEFPLTPNGKIDKKKLPAASGNLIKSGAEYEAPVTENEKILAKVWQDLLNNEQIGVNESFFTIGGDSIKAIQVVSRLRQEGLKLEVRDIFNYTTIKELALHVKLGARAIDQGLVTGEMALTPIQHWHFDIFKGGEAHYNHAVMLHFKERIKAEALQTAINAIYEHHDALRTTFKTKGKIKAVISDNLKIDVLTKDLTASSNTSGDVEKFANEVQASIDLQKGPLIKVAHIQLKDSDRLLIVIHHLIVDGISWRVIFEDINVAYTSALKNEKIKLPQKTDSFKLWSESLEKYSKNEFLLNQKDFWKSVENTTIEAIEPDVAGERNLLKDKAALALSLDAETTTNLLGQANKAYNTEINDLLLTGFSLAMNNWKGLHNTIISLEGHGRENIEEELDISRTIGWFTSMYPVVIHVNKEQKLSTQISRVKENLRKIPNKGIGYGVLKYLTNELKAEFRPQILFNYLGQFDAGVKESVFTIASESAGDFVNPNSERAFLMEVNGMVSGGQLTITIMYSKKQFKEETIKTLLENYIAALQQITEHCLSEKDTTYTASDFAYKDMVVEDLGVEDLDELFD